VNPDLAELLSECAEAGMAVEFYAPTDACAVCQELAGQTFDPAEAPVIPVARCENDACRCDYLPVSN
jgi:hypothetical protein